MRSSVCALVLLLLLALPAQGAEKAPTLDGTLLDGKPFHLAEHRGHMVLVHFWATWCAPCRAEMATLDAYYKKHHAEGLDIIAISMDDDAATARDFMKAYSFPAALYDDMSAEGYGRITRLPQTIVITRDGAMMPLEDVKALEKLKL